MQPVNHEGHIKVEVEHKLSSQKWFIVPDRSSKTAMCWGGGDNFFQVKLP